MLCREMRLPYDMTKPTYADENDEDTESYVTQLHQRMAEVWEQARINISQGKERQKKYYDKKATPSTLQVGDYVLYYDKRGYKGLTSKLIKRWQGIYVIKEINDTNASIQRYNNPD